MRKIPDSAPRWECTKCGHKILTGQMCQLKKCPHCGRLDTLVRCNN